MENKQESKEEFSKEWNNSLISSKINLFGLRFLVEIEKEMGKVNLEGTDEYSYLGNISYQEGLKKSIEVFKRVKETFKAE